jgi:hypothetical protein
MRRAFVEIGALKAVPKAVLVPISSTQEPFYGLKV